MYPASILPALLVTILIFMDQQITAVIVNRKENKLKVRLRHEQIWGTRGRAFFLSYFGGISPPTLVSLRKEICALEEDLCDLV